MSIEEEIEEIEEIENSDGYNPEWEQYGFTYRDWLEQNGVCPDCGDTETFLEYEPNEDGEIRKCRQCGHWFGIN